jgi:hypothetical protein
MLMPVAHHSDQPAWSLKERMAIESRPAQQQMVATACTKPLFALLPERPQADSRGSLLEPVEPGCVVSPGAADRQIDLENTWI